MAFAFSIPFSLALEVQEESYSFIKLVEKSTLVPLESSDSLSEVGGVFLGSHFWEISFCSFVCTFSSIVPISKRGTINFENFEISSGIVSNDPSYDRSMKG